MISTELLTKGGTRWRERLEDSLRRSGISRREYNENKSAAIRRLIGLRFLMPLQFDMTSSYGERWRQFFQFITNTEDYQTVDIVRNTLFPYIGNGRLAKKGSLLSVGGWDGKLTVREAIEAKQKSFSLEGIQGVGDIPVAFGFAGASANSHEKVTTLYNWLKGRKMYASLTDPQELRYALEGNQLMIRLQIGNQDRALESGIRVIGRVPSFRGDGEPHDVAISNLPIYQISQGVSDAAKRKGYDVFVQDGCKRNFFSDDKFGRLPGFDEEAKNENELDHHFVLVVEAASRLVSEQYPRLAIDNPIPEIPKGVEELVEVAFRRIRVFEPSKNKATMLWESTNLMQVYTMMALAYQNSRRLAESRP